MSQRSPETTTKRRRDIYDDVPPEWRPGGAVYRARFGDPVPRGPLRKAADAVGVVLLSVLTLVVTGIPAQLVAFVSWLTS